MAPQLHGPAGLGASAPQLCAFAASGIAYKGMSFRVCVAPQLCSPAAARHRRFRVRRPRNCVASRIAYKGM